MRFLLLLSLLIGCQNSVSITKQKEDVDEDGYVADIDCDDGHKSVHPDAPELCDGLDNDCDDVIDEDSEEASTFYADADGDGYGDLAAPINACDRPDGYVVDSSDCDDNEEKVHPKAPEVCDSLDNDCNGLVDDNATDMQVFAADSDGDGYGDPDDTVTACEAPPGYVLDATDCDDQEKRIHPGAKEDDCTDPIDYNCDGSVTYADADGDGWAACEDCDDLNGRANPDEKEVCDRRDVDEDCSGLADDQDPNALGKSTWYQDADGDGYAPANALTVTSCDQPAGYVATMGDCNDADAAISPAAQEVCDSANTDEDCDGLADDADSSVDLTTGRKWFQDADVDSYGDPNAFLIACDQPSGYVSDSQDCDDSDSTISPAGQEICDAADADEDCDGLSDDKDSSVAGQSLYYTDLDGDNYGASTLLACDPPASAVLVGGDCNDSDAGISPGTAEICEDGIDQNCDSVDDLCGSCVPGSTQVVLSTLNYNGMSYYMLALDPCLPHFSGNCCSGTQDQEEADAFCQLAGYCEAANYVVELKSSTSCYCWGACTNNTWYSPCCSGTDSRYFITQVTCQ